MRRLPALAIVLETQPLADAATNFRQLLIGKLRHPKMAKLWADFAAALRSQNRRNQTAARLRFMLIAASINKAEPAKKRPGGSGTELTLATIEPELSRCKIQARC